MKLSIIIPTIGKREEEIKKLLSQLVKFNKNISEIIIPVDESEEISNYVIALKKINRKIKLLYSKKRRGRCKAKNEGAKMAKGDILVFLDDDVEILNRNYFKILSEDFSNHRIAAVSGKEIKNKKISKIKRFISNKVGLITSLGEVISNFDTPLKRPKIVLALPGCNFAIRRDVFQLVGGFDENYDIGTAYREETDLQMRVTKLGYKLLFDPRISVIHKERESPDGLKRWFKWYYILNTYFFLKNFTPSTFKFLLFVFKEILGSMARILIYKKPYPIIYLPGIIHGIMYFKEKIKKSCTSRSKSLI